VQKQLSTGGEVGDGDCDLGSGERRPRGDRGGDLSGEPDRSSLEVLWRDEMVGLSAGIRLVVDLDR
jgi:hypothetical protein